MHLLKDFWQSGTPCAHETTPLGVLPAASCHCTSAAVPVGRRAPAALLLPAPARSCPGLTPGWSVQAGQGAWACPMPGGAACLQRGVLPSAPISGEAAAQGRQELTPTAPQSKGGGHLPAAGNGSPCPLGAPGAVHDPGRRRMQVAEQRLAQLLAKEQGGQGLHTPWGAATLPALAHHCPQHGQHPDLAQAAAPPGLRCRNLAVLPAPAPQCVGGGLGLLLLQKTGGPSTPPAPACCPYAIGPRCRGQALSLWCRGTFGTCLCVLQSQGQPGAEAAPQRAPPRKGPQRGVGRVLSAAPQPGWGQGQAGAGACGRGDYTQV